MADGGFCALPAVSLCSCSDSYIMFFGATDSHSSEAPPEGEEIFCWTWTIPVVTRGIGTVDISLPVTQHAAGACAGQASGGFK